MEHQKEEMVRKAEITTTLMERVKRSALLTELTKLRPAGVNFVAIDLKTKDVAPPAGAKGLSVRISAAEASPSPGAPFASSQRPRTSASNICTPQSPAGE
jgi:hypothetical protein